MYSIMVVHSSLLFVHGDLPASGCTRTLLHYAHARRVNEMIFNTLDVRNLFVLYRDLHIISGSFCAQVVPDASTYASQVRPLCACMPTCLRIAFYYVYTAPFF